MMRKMALLGGSALLLLATGGAQAETLRQALEAAYRANPRLTEQRARVRASDENVPIARAAGRPQMDASGVYQENVLKGDQTGNFFTSDPDRQLVGQFNVNVPLIGFGAVRNSVRAAEARSDASRHGLRGTEADLFTRVVAAYMDVIRDEATVRLNQRNRSVIEYTLARTRDRFEIGDAGPTDVAQAEARVALAISQLETAEARLIASRENYIRLVGNPPGDLAPPPPLPQFPATSDEAVRIALDNNATLLAAQAESRAARHDVDVADAESLPRISAIGGLNRYDYLGSLAPNTGPRNRDQGTTGYVGVQLKMPLYQGGRVAAQARQARQKYGMTIEQIAAAERDAVAETRSAFANWRSTSRVIDAARNGVRANERALTGIRAEVKNGLRPLLDQLNADQELLNAEVTLVTAERDAYVAGFALLAAMGRAEARHLDFDGALLYDPMVNYDSVRNRVSPFEADQGPMPRPAATGTAATPAQDAAVKAP
jgi:outer membrane protein